MYKIQSADKKAPNKDVFRAGSQLDGVGSYGPAFNPRYSAFVLETPKGDPVGKV